MSDFLHHYSDLANIMAHRQRRDALEQQQRSLELQLAQARQAAAHNARMQEHAARVEELERQRVSIEQERLSWQIQHEELKGQKAQRIRNMRKLLCERINGLPPLRCAALANAAPALPLDGASANTPTRRFDIPLTTHFALLHAEVHFLTEQDVFDELTDMQALTQYRADLGETISNASRGEYTADNPWQFVRDAVASRVRLLREMAHFMEKCVRSVTKVTARPLHSFRESEIVSLYRELHELLGDIPRTFAEFARRIKQERPPLGIDLDSQDVKNLHGIYHDLSDYYAFLEAHKMSEQDFLECAEGKNTKYSELVASLQSASKLCESWQSARDEALARIKEINAQATAGNYVTAEALYKKCPFDFAGFDFKETARAVNQWRATISEWSEKWTSAKYAHTTQMRRIAGFGRLSLVSKCAPKLARLIAPFQKLEQDVRAMTDCEYQSDVLKLLDSIGQEIAQLNQEAAQAERKAATKFVVVISTVFFGALVALVFYQSRKDYSEHKLPNFERRSSF